MIIDDINIIYIILIVDAILLFIGFLIAQAMHEFHKNVVETAKLLDSSDKISPI